MNLRRVFARSATILGVLAAAGCGRDGGAAAAQTAAPSSDEPALPGAIVVNKQIRAAIAVDTPQLRDETSTLTVAGKLQFDEDRLAHVLAPIAGQIIDLRVKVGDSVQRGQPLCSINSREVAAAIGEHVESHKDLELAEKTMAMTADLFEHQAASRMAFEQAQNDLAKAQSRVARTEESLRVLGIDPESASATGRVTIASPLTGTLIERKVTSGQFVQPESVPIMTVADISTVWAIGDVFERDLHLLAVGRPAQVSVVAYPGETFQGRVDYISDVIDPATRTAKLRISVRNPRGRLKPEMFASIAVGVGEAVHVLMLPSRAAFFENGQAWVYVAVGRDQVIRRPIELGEEHGVERRVLSGLAAGDQVVVDGALLLRQEEKKRAG